MENQNTVLIGNIDIHNKNFVQKPLIDAPLWWHDAGLQKTASGYGTKIETRHKVEYMGRKRRIYVDVYSNAGYTYIMVKGAKISVR